MALDTIIRKNAQRQEFEKKVESRYRSLLKQRALDEIPVLHSLTARRPSEYLVQTYFREYLEHPSFTSGKPCFYEFSKLKEVSGVIPQLKTFFVRTLYHKFSLSQQNSPTVPLIDIVEQLYALTEVTPQTDVVHREALQLLKNREFAQLKRWMRFAQPESIYPFITKMSQSLIDAMLDAAYFHEPFRMRAYLIKMRELKEVADAPLQVPKEETLNLVRSLLYQGDVANLAALDELIPVKGYVEDFHAQILIKNLAALGRFKELILLKKKFGIELEEEIVELGLKQYLG